jgi:Rrf2 family protein
MFSQTSEYTLRVVVFLARLRGKPATNRQIAAATRVPEGYLAKILQSLSRARLVRSQRGLRGGSSLLRDPDQITVYEVMEVASPMPRIHQCPLGLPRKRTASPARHKAPSGE